MFVLVTTSGFQHITADYSRMAVFGHNFSHVIETKNFFDGVKEQRHFKPIFFGGVNKSLLVRGKNRYLCTFGTKLAPSKSR